MSKHGLISVIDFYSVLKDNGVVLDEDAKNLLQMKFVVKSNNTIPYWDALKLVNINLQATWPFDSAWVIWKKHKKGDNVETLSVASSYFLTSILSSKWMNVDDILSE